MKYLLFLLLLIVFTSCRDNSTEPLNEEQFNRRLSFDKHWRLVYQDGKHFTYHKNDSVKIITMTSDSTTIVLRYKKD